MITRFTSVIRLALTFAGIYLYDLNNATSSLIHEDKYSDPTIFWYAEASQQLYAVEYETTIPKYVFLSDGEEEQRP